MSQKGQITMLVIVGIAILVGVLAVFYFTSERQGVQDFDTSLLSADGSVTPRSLETYTKSCLESTFKETPTSVLANHFYLQNKNMIRENIPYFYFSGLSTLPTKQELQDRYAQDYRDEVISCIDGFEIFSKYLEGDLIYDDSLVDLKTFVEEGEITVTVDTHATLTDSTGATQTQGPVSYTFASNIGSIYHTIDLLLNPIQPYDFFYEPGVSYATQRGFVYMITPERDGDLVFYLNELENEQLSYVFSFHGLFSS
ncbi:hypothetical protein JXA48_04620 [Candidatus Woesearchaeota archaeon]|nr:hypothetical protein [Candidatus Woesearchaeota archaeon]